MNTVVKNERFETLENSHWGSEQFYRHPFIPNLIKTEGINDFTEQFKCSWLFDEMAIAMKNIIINNHKDNCLFNVITVTAKNGKVDIDMKHDTDEPVFYHKHIAHSDLENGVYETWLIGTPTYNDNGDIVNVLYTWLLKSEY